MRKFMLVAAAMCAAVTVGAQGSAEVPVPLTDGVYPLTVNPNDYQQVYYFSYTAAEDALLSLTLPTPTATVIASESLIGDRIQSDIPLLSAPDYTAETTEVKCFASKDAPVYLKVTLRTFALEASSVPRQIAVSSEPYTINYGVSISDPIDMNTVNPAFLPLTALDEAPFGLKPVYVTYTAPQSGWLYLRFKPSVTQVQYSSTADGEFLNLKHEYIVEDGKTVGAKALLQVGKDDTFYFKITGFNPSMLTLNVENPEPGTTWDFPIDITPGDIELPAAAGDYYYRLTPERESFIEVTSATPDLPGGYVEVAMDGQGTGAFYIYNQIHLRTHVYDRMEYYVHFFKAQSSASPQLVNIALMAPEECDDRFDGQPVMPGETYYTPPFAGTYYYRITPPASGSYEIVLTTLERPESADTRVNLYDINEIGETLARGLDLTYLAEAGKEYLMQWTVFDTNHAIPFRVELLEHNAITEISADSDSDAPLYDLSGRRIITPRRGFYISNSRLMFK